jgi:argininosuccinate lyase
MPRSSPSPRRKRATRRTSTPSKNGAPKPWGGRFGDATDRLVEAYTQSIDADARLLPYDIAGSMAHAKMLAAQGIISDADAGKITAGLTSILDDFYRGQFELKPELEDVHMNVEARLAEKIGPVAGRLHTARSRNDQV